MNPSLDCNNYLTPNDIICLNDGTFNCISYYTLNETERSCQSIADVLGLNITTFMTINPGLDCSKVPLESTVKKVCSNAINPPCQTFYKVVEDDTIESIVQKNNINLNDFYKANPYATQDGLQTGQRICVKIKTSPSNIDLFSNQLDLLADYDPEVMSALVLFHSEPTSVNHENIKEKFKNAILTNTEFRKMMAYLENNDPAITAYYQSYNISRQSSCNQFTNSNSAAYVDIRECYCNSKEPIVYCSLLFHQQMMDNLGNFSLPPGTFSFNINDSITVSRKKRGAPQCAADQYCNELHFCQSKNFYLTYLNLAFILSN